jgi:hypothetical protein
MSLTGRRLTYWSKARRNCSRLHHSETWSRTTSGHPTAPKKIASKPARMCPEPHPLAGGQERFDRLAGGGESAAEMTVARQFRSVPSEAGTVQKYCTTVQF